MSSLSKHFYLSLILLSLMPLCPALSKTPTTSILDKANLEYQHGNYDKVLAMLTVTHQVPELILKGRALIWKNSADTTPFFEALALAPHNSQALCWRGYSELFYRRYREAEPWLEQAINCDASNAEALAMLSFCLSKDGEAQKGAYLIDKALHLKPQSDVVLEFAANVSESQSDVKGAELFYDRLIRAFPTMPRAWDLKGLLFEKEGNLKEAESCFKKALAINNRFEESMEHLANLLLRQNRFKESIEQSSKCIQLKSLSGDYFGCFRLRALAHEGLKQYDAAAADWKGFLSQPSLQGPRGHSSLQADALLALCRDYELLSNYPKALETNSQLLAFRPNSKRARIEEAKIYEAMGNLSKSLSIYDKLLAQDDTVAELYRARAKILRALGRSQTAALDESKARELGE